MNRLLPLLTIVLSIFLTGCDATRPEPEPDLSVEPQSGSVSADLNVDFAYWEESISAHWEVSGVEVGGDRHQYTYNVRIHYRVYRTDDHEAESDTLTKTVRSGSYDHNRSIYARVDHRTAANDEWLKPDSAVIEVRMREHGQQARSVITDFIDGRGGDGSLE